MFILLLFLLLRISHCYIGFTRYSLYEKNESTSIAWKNEDIPENLQKFFEFQGTTLLVTPPDGLSIEFIIARPEKETDNFIAEWCAPAKEEYDKCDNEMLYICNTPTEYMQDFEYNICNLKHTSMAFNKINGRTSFTMGARWPWPEYLPDSFKCFRMVTMESSAHEIHVAEIFEHNTWVLSRKMGGAYVGGLKNIPSPGHPGYHQSGRMLNGKFCEIPFRFPDSGLVFQKGIRKIKEIPEIIESLPTTPILFNQTESDTTAAPAVITSTILPTEIPIDYLIAIICGGICGGIILIAMICLIGILLIRRKLKETFNGQPLLSLEPINNNSDDSVSAKIKPSELPSAEPEATPSLKQSISKVESIQGDCGYSKLIKDDFDNSQKVLPPPADDNKNSSIIQFLTQEFNCSTPIKGPKSTDELLQEALEEPLAKTRAEKLLQVVIKANNELYSLGYRNKLVDSSKFRLTTPSNSEALLQKLKGGDFLKFVISVSEKDIDGKNGEFVEDLRLWKKFVEEIDVFECFRHACLFGQTMKRRQFFVMATFYKVSLLIAENPNRNDLLSMNYPVPFFIYLCEKYPQYFEIH